MMSLLTTIQYQCQINNTHRKTVKRDNDKSLYIDKSCSLQRTVETFLMYWIALLQIYYKTAIRKTRTPSYLNEI